MASNLQIDLNDDRVRAEILKLMAETTHLNAETRRLNRGETLEPAKLMVEIEKLVADTLKLNAETPKLLRERWWHPFVVVGGLLVGLAAIVSGTVALLHLFGKL